MIKKESFEKFKILRDKIYSELPNATHEVSKIESYDVITNKKAALNIKKILK